MGARPVHLDTRFCLPKLEGVCTVRRIGSTRGILGVPLGWITPAAAAGCLGQHASNAASAHLTPKQHMS